MKRHMYTLAALALASAMALGQQSQTVQPPPVPQDNHEHLSKKERKRLKKERDRERKEEKRRLKKEAKERKQEDKRHEKQVAKEEKQDRDHDRKQDDKRMTKERRVDRERGQDAESHPSMAGRAASAGVGIVKAPFRLARYATPRMLRAQRDVSHAIYTAFPASNVAVMLSDAGQIVLRGAAPTPDMRARLLQVAMGAAGGYPIVDQLAADFVGDAASAAADAAVGGVSDLIHGNGSAAPPPDNGQYASADNGSYAAPPASAAAPPDPTAVAALEPGTSACVNVSHAQVLLTGQATSEASAELIRQFARQLGGASATLNDQLALRSDGTTAAPSADANTMAASGLAAVTPGSNVCVNVTSANEVLLSGTVGAPQEMTAVERAAQPLVASARLSDNLTIGSVGPAGASAVIAAPSNPPAASTGVATEETALEQTLHAIPRLSGVDAVVTADAVQLTGTVDTSQDDQRARDIARHYAPGASVIDQINVAGQTPQP